MTAKMLGLFKAHILLHHSTLGLRVIQKKRMLGFGVSDVGGKIKTPPCRAFLRVYLLHLGR